MATYQISWLVALFNNSGRLPIRRAMYESLKAHKLLGKVFNGNAQKLLRPYLFDSFEGGWSWPDYPVTQSAVIDKRNGERVNAYFDTVFEGRTERDNYPKMRGRSECHMYVLLRELDYRADLMGGIPRLSLGHLPCSFEMLKRLIEQLPTNPSLEDLRGKSEADFLALHMSKQATKSLARFVAEKLPKLPEPKVTRKAQALRLQPVLEL